MTSPAMTASRDGGRPKPPGIMYGILALVILLILATLTITAAQTPPPAIAEFAPQATQQIQQAPSEQASVNGHGQGGGEGSALAGPTTTTTSTPATVPGQPTIERARLRKCFGNPPRQTEDPQSPPCVPFFDGDNGGATTRGVTRDEIRVAVPRSTDASTMAAIEAYFNKRYEFYGRKLTLVNTGAFGSACTDQRAAATTVASQQIFAATDAGTANSTCFFDELARLKVISSEIAYAFTESQLAARHPYIWEYLMSVDRLMSTAGELVCARLAGGKATHSTDAVTQGKPRVFGIILETANRDDTLPLSPVENALAKCGVKPAAEVAYDFSEDQGTRGRDAVVKMQNAGVTSVICLCDIVVEDTLAPAATSQAYFPEWIVNSYGSNDYDTLVKASWPDVRQRAALFGFTAQPPQRPRAQEYGWMAYKETDPSITADEATYINDVTLYRSLLLIASGIQMAGPKLTPQTFASGLQSTPFPNPADPGYSGAVGFLGPDHGMTNDAAEMWWSETATGADGASGGMCYVDGGARRTPGAWPTGSDPFFTGPCKTGFQ